MKVKINLDSNFIYLNDDRYVIGFDGKTLTSTDCVLNKTKINSYFLNTIYTKYYINKYLRLKDFITKIKPTVKKIKIMGFNGDNRFLFGINNIELTANVFILWFYLKFVIDSIISPIKILIYWFVTSIFIFFISFPKKKVNTNIFVYANCNASYKNLIKYLKFNKIDSKIISDPVNIKKGEANIFQLVSTWNILKILFNSLVSSYNLFYKSVFEFKILFKSKITVAVCYDYLVKRVVYSEISRLSLSDYISKNKHKIKSFISGCRDERYSTYQQRICERNNIKSICVPHGLAYSYKYPHGLFGNEYLCFSASEQNYLKKIFTQNPEKYVLNVPWIENLLRRDSTNEYKFVYCTDSRNIKEDYKLLEFLSKSYKIVYVKLHPNDRESNYNNLKNIKFLSDLSEAFKAKTFISRASTILLDSSYNNKLALAICISEHDNYLIKLYPGLDDKKIKRVKSKKELKQLINFENFNSAK